MRPDPVTAKDPLTITAPHRHADFHGKGDHFAGLRAWLTAEQTAMSAPFPPRHPYSARS